MSRKGEVSQLIACSNSLSATTNTRGKKPKMRVILIRLGWLWATTAVALVVYDCEKPHARVKTLDLTGPQECDNPEKDFLPAEEIWTQFLHTGQRHPVKTTQCDITISKRITRCGKFDSITYAGFYTA